MLRRSLGMPSPQRWAAKFLGHAWYIGKRFLQIYWRLLQPSLSRKSQILGWPGDGSPRHAQKQAAADSQGVPNLRVWQTPFDSGLALAGGEG